MKSFLFLIFLATAVQAATLNPMEVLHSRRAVICYGADNISIALNAARNAVKYTVEGESPGPRKVVNVSSDNSTYVSYITQDGWLTFNARGSFYRARGEQQTSVVNCNWAR